MPSLPLLPLVVGTQVPDLPLFFAGLTPPYEVTHAMRSGAAPNLAYGLALVFTCEWMRPALIALLAAPARRRLVDLAIPQWPGSTRALLSTIVAVLLGATSHIVWDEFTHEGRWGMEHIPSLGEPWAFSYPGYRVLQYGCGVLGVLFMVGWSARRYRRRVERTDVIQRWPEPARVLTIATLLVAPLGCVVWSYQTALHDDSGSSLSHAFAFRFVTSTLAAEFLLCLAARLLFYAASMRTT